MFGASPPDAEDMEGFRQRMTSCFGLPGNSSLDYTKPPLLVVMNRPPGQHRSIHNGNELAAHLHENFKTQGAVVRHMIFEDSMTLQEQAQLFSRIAVLIQVRQC